MHNDSILHSNIQSLVKTSLGESIISIELLPGAGSNRHYYRVCTAHNSYIVCNGTQVDENKSFIYLSNHFYNKGLRVPKVYGHTPEFNIYILQDLGNTDLLSFKLQSQEHEWLPLYKQALTDIAQFQCKGIEGLDFSHCYARNEFDSVYMNWDLSYFKYYYCKLTDIEINEQKLEEDYNTLISFLLQSPRSFFMYRDFQSRNIMLHNNELWYIDFQGGMRGALQYDVVSLLYQAKANFTEKQRNELLEHYLNQVSKYMYIDLQEFKTLYEGFICIRILQTLGAYGYRGIIQKKPHFIASIPQALENAKQQCNIVSQIIQIPYLQTLIQQLPLISNTHE